MAVSSYVFEDFELDLKGYELRRNSRTLKLEKIPMELLILLISRKGELVTREELVEKLWGKDVFIEAEHSLNTAIRKIRQTIHDDPVRPRYLQTVVGKGYRFIGKPNGLSPEIAAAPSEESAKAETEAAIATTSPLRRTWWRNFALVTAGGGIFALAVVLASRWPLGHSAQATEPPQIRSLAVLPLADTSGGAEEEYLSDGMTDALITELGQIESLRVISRTSSMRYKGTNKALSEIARELNVDAVVEGTIVHSGNRVRITANLLRASPESHLWAQAYERDMRDVLRLQDEVARSIAQVIRARLTPEEHTRLARSQSVDPQAYNSYLRGLYLLTLAHTTSDEWKRSGQFLQQAIAKDPTYAPAYVALARYYLIETGGLQGPGSIEQKWVAAEAASERALALDGSLAEAHALAAELRMMRHWDWAGGQREYKRALEQNPNSVEAHGGYAAYLLTEGRYDEGLRENKRALELDPLRLELSEDLGRAFYFARRYDDAINQLETSVELDANSLSANYWLAAAHERKGMYKEAAAEYVRYLSLSRRQKQAKQFERVYKTQGYLAAKRLDNQLLIRELKNKLPVNYWEIARSYARLGETNAAFEWLEKAYDARSFFLFLIRVEPDFDNLRSDPRYADLVRRIGFPQ